MEKKLPSGRIGRLARLAALGARTGVSAIVGAEKTAAERAADVLGTMRGLAAKVGQMGSYVDGLVPEDKREAYETSLKVLRAQAPRSSTAEIRSLVESELGAPLDRLFASWEDVPIASASIGQVHRATTTDGHAVAVKVQHPGVDAAVEADLGNAGVLEAIGGALGGRRFDSKAFFEVVAARFREELDYTLEAERLRAFAAVHAGDPTVHVPAVHDALSSRRVLTTELVTGLGMLGGDHPLDLLPLEPGELQDLLFNSIESRTGPQPLEIALGHAVLWHRSLGCQIVAHAQYLLA